MQNNLYRADRDSFSFSDIVFAVIFAVGYFLCALPSFRNIGNIVLQVFLSLFLSAVLTVGGLLLKNGLKFTGIALSIFTVFETLLGIYVEIKAQLASETPFKGWIYVFYYDKPMTVGIIWGAAFFVVTFLRLFLPLNLTDKTIKNDYILFFKGCVPGFLFFYAACFFYGFLFVRLGAATTGLNLIPFDTLAEYFSPAMTTYEGIIYIIGNLICIMPIGLFLGLYRPETKKSVFIVLPFILSILAEGSQFLFHIGDCDIDDVILNVIGFYIGASMRFLCDIIRKKITGGKEETIFGGI
ncbi:MAG: VanZ family protein [Clostridiales bacterium]|nr:VanZ family protein [Clostridiales bacterium]